MAVIPMKATRLHFPAWWLEEVVAEDRARLEKLWTILGWWCWPARAKRGEVRRKDRLQETKWLIYIGCVFWYIVVGNLLVWNIVRHYDHSRLANSKFEEHLWSSKMLSKMLMRRFVQNLNFACNFLSNPNLCAVEIQVAFLSDVPTTQKISSQC